MPVVLEVVELMHPRLGVLEQLVKEMLVELALMPDHITHLVVVVVLELQVQTIIQALVVLVELVWLII